MSLVAVSDQELMDVDGGQGHFRNGRLRVAGSNRGRGSYTDEERRNARRTGALVLGGLSFAAGVISGGATVVAFKAAAGSALKASATAAGASYGTLSTVAGGTGWGLSW